MKYRVLKILPFIILVLIAAGAVMLVRQRKVELEAMDTAKIPPLPVQVAEAGYGKIEVARNYLGVIEPEVSAALESRITGHLEAVRFDTGDRVKKDEIVAIIDDRLLQKELSALQAELEGAAADLEDRKNRYERRKELYERGHVNAEDLEAARSAFVSARARASRVHSEIQAAQISLLYTQIKAPFDGIITDRMLDPGDLVMPGRPVCRLEDPEQGYKIIVKTDPETARLLETGTPARLKSGAGTTTAEVFRIHPATDKQQLATVEIRSEKPPFGLPSGATLGVDLVPSTPEAIVLPRRAAVEIDGKWRVFIAGPDNGIKVAEVSVIGRTGEQIAVKSDALKAGDRVAVGDESMLIRLGPHTRIQPFGEKGAAAGKR